MGYGAHSARTTTNPAQIMPALIEKRFIFDADTISAISMFAENQVRDPLQIEAITENQLPPILGK